MPKQLLNDQKLVAFYVKGDESALHALIMRHKKKIFNYIMCIVKDQYTAEDVFQDTFYKFIVSLRKGNYVENDRFLPWVMRIAHNLAIDTFSVSKKEKTTSYIINDVGEEIDIYTALKLEYKNSNRKLNQSETRKVIFRLMETLPQRQKEVVMMHHYFNMSFSEIAKLTNVSINTSLGRMRYGINNLRKTIERRKIEF